MNKPDPSLNVLRAAAAGGPADARIQLATTLLNQFAFGTAEFDEACAQLLSAAKQGAPAADLMLGHVYLRNGSMERASENAFECFERASQAGLPEATERLADLLLSGRLNADDRRAVSLYADRASAYDAPALCNLAYLKIANEMSDTDQIEATRLYLQAAVQGYTLAFQAAAIRLTRGWGCLPDPIEGYAWLLLSAARKFPLADRLLHRYGEQLAKLALAQAQHRAEELKSAIRSLGERIANENATVRTPDAAAQHFREAVEETYHQTCRVQPRDSGPKPPTLVTKPTCSDPRVLSVDSFADELDMAHLVDASLPELKSPSQVEALRGGTEVDAFDGDAAMFSPSFSTPAMRLVQRRFARLLKTDVRRFEPMSVLHYGPGHGYSPHFDYFSPDRIAAHEAVGDFGGQREITCLVYLMAPMRGGETHYPTATCEVTGAPGMAVIHYNVDESGAPNPNSLHEGRRIVSGDKWLARTAVRASRLY